MRFCTKCGVELQKSWKHCPSCGEASAKTNSYLQQNSKLPKANKVSKAEEVEINDYLELLHQL
jgi:uncharacterized membrane protein YvbJ